MSRPTTAFLSKKKKLPVGPALHYVDFILARRAKFKIFVT